MFDFQTQISIANTKQSHFHTGVMIEYYKFSILIKISFWTVVSGTA